MRKISVISALVLAIIATIWSTLPAFTFAFVPAILAILIGYFGLLRSKNKVKPKKTAQLAILLSGLALILTAYKLVFTPEVITSTQNQEIEQPVLENQAEDELDDSDELETEAEGMEKPKSKF